MTDTHTAAVKTLTAEVRVLQVNSSQITAGIVRQLDLVLPKQMEPWGRVKGDFGCPCSQEPRVYSQPIIGVDKATGALVTACVHLKRDRYPYGEPPPFYACVSPEQWEAVNTLPLSVLAGK